MFCKDAGIDVESVGQLDGNGLPLGRGDLNAHLRAAAGEAVFSRLRDVHGGVCAGVRDVDGVAWVGIPVVPGSADALFLIRFLGGYRNRQGCAAQRTRRAVNGSTRGVGLFRCCSR